MNGDPTTDILATRDIAGVWKRGVMIDRARYLAELGKARADVRYRDVPRGARLRVGRREQLRHGRAHDPVRVGVVRSYAIMMVARSKGQMPVIQRFTTSADWKEVVLPIASFQGIDARDLMGIAFVASGTPGVFHLAIDEVRLR